MSMYDQFETDETMETPGVYLEYGDFRIKIARAGGANKKYLSYAEAKTKPFRRAIQAGTFSAERSRALMHDIFAKTVVLNWEVADGVGEDGATKWKKGIHKKDGGILEFTPENVITTFKNLPSLFDDVQQGAEGISLFRKEELEADAKNS